MKLRAVVFGALVMAATVAAPATAEEGIHVSPGAVDEHGCYALDVWNGDVPVKTIPAVYSGDNGCATLERTAFLSNGILLFGWRAPINSPYPFAYGIHLEVWASDGMTDGTVRLSGFGGGYKGLVCHGDWRIVGRSAYISGRCDGDGDSSTSIVATRGTPASTWTLPGRPLQNAWPAYVVRHGRIFYGATDQAKGRELWVSNGIVAGTHVVKDIRPGARGSYPRHLSSDGSRLRFTADDGTGRRWWVSDGTRAGTHPE